MKVPQSIGDIYDERIGEIERLSVSAQNLIRGYIRKEWHYVDRVKGRESFTLKVETGRVPDPRFMEDFFACTIVVRTMAEVSDAESIIVNLFEVGERRPSRASHTN